MDIARSLRYPWLLVFHKLPFSFLFISIWTAINFSLVFALQGSKCLYLGIDDDRKDVGTTGRTFFWPLHL